MPNGFYLISTASLIQLPSLIMRVAGRYYGFLPLLLSFTSRTSILPPDKRSSQGIQATIVFFSLIRKNDGEPPPLPLPPPLKITKYTYTKRQIPDDANEGSRPIALLIVFPFPFRNVLIHEPNAAIKDYLTPWMKEISCSERKKKRRAAEKRENVVFGIV